MNRLLAFVLIVAITLGAIGFTTPALLDKVRLGLDLKGGFEILYEAEPLTPGGEITRDSLRETAVSLEKRANATGVAEPEVTPEGTNRIRVKIAGVSDEAAVREILKKPAELTFRSTRGCKAEEGFCNVELLGADFKENGASIYQNQLGGWEISISLKSQSKFAQVTREVSQLQDNRLAIYLNDEQLSAPSVQREINSENASITGTFTREEAKQIADTINLGALPLKLTEKYTQSVGATLGQQSLDKTIFAGAIGAVFVLLFMLFVYRLPGLVAVISLALNTWLVLTGFVLLNATITLPGIAALILGLGMAVDANIITAERIKDELRSGKSLLSSLKAGSKNSFRTIMDANITTALAGIVMLFIPNSSIRGFAVMLLLGIVVSLVANMSYSRLLLYLLIRSGRFQNKQLYSVKESEIRAL
ncbi:protein translocase subunit SecD [Paenibacillus darwinianus]|uniref:protein translocase subunit SecD n=1 Tax=Paenibacillus darwinianus TaxID=1380763 RepID=UPI000564529E|nr:protein translocase subunit SecD [Paenibacillus darwinianus]